MKKLVNLCLWLVLPSLLLAQNTPKQKTAEEIQKIHQDAKTYISLLENPQRDEEQKPHEVITALSIKSGEAIADIGAGSGYFAFRFARHVGDNGRVYAVDISPDMILHMNRYISEAKLNNVITVLSAEDNPLLPAVGIDRFFICNTWHHIQKQENYIGLMKKMLKPGGQVVILDYKKEELPVGPPPEMKIGRGEVVQQFESNGFKLTGEHTFLPYQYFLIFVPR
jgi:arsenite methyltransferase